MAINQSRLTPQEQSLLFQLSQKAGTQPTSNMGEAQPMTASDPAAQAGGDPHMDAFMAGMTKSAPMQGPQAPNQQEMAPKLNWNPGDATFRQTTPANTGLGRLLGITHRGPAQSTVNWLSAYKGQFGANAALPANLPIGPDGQPFLSEDQYKQLVDPTAKGLALGQKTDKEAPSVELGKAVLERARTSLNPEEYKALEQYVTTNKGIVPSKLGEVNSAFLTSRKEGDIFATPLGPAFRDRTTGKIEHLVSPEHSPAALGVIKDEAGSWKSDAVIQANRELLAGMDNVVPLIKGNNPAARGAIEGYLARAIAVEKGVLTEQDVLRNTGSRALADRFTRFIKTNVNGQLTDTDAKEFGSLLKQVYDGAKKRYDLNTQAIAERGAKRLKAAGVPVDAKRVREMIEAGVDYGTFSQDPNQPATPQTPQNPVPNIGDTFHGAKVTKVKIIKKGNP
jgi:hypothetical protein